MKRILKGLLIAIATLGCSGLQAMRPLAVTVKEFAEQHQHITSIQMSEQNPTEFTLLGNYPPYEGGKFSGFDPVTGGSYRADEVISRRFLIHNKGLPVQLKQPFLIGVRLCVFHERNNTMHCFTPWNIQEFDKENTSGKWLLKINDDGTPSFEKPKDA